MSRKQQKHPAQIPKKQLASTLRSVGSAFKQVAVAAAGHPATAALFVMGGTVLLQIALKPAENRGSQTAKDINFQLGGLYNGAQGLAVASALAPVVAGVAQSAAGAVGSLYGKPPP